RPDHAAERYGAAHLNRECARLVRVVRPNREGIFARPVREVAAVDGAALVARHSDGCADAAAILHARDRLAAPLIAVVTGHAPRRTVELEARSEVGRRHR